MAKIILSNDKFLGALKVYAKFNRSGAMDLIGSYHENCDGFRAVLGDGTIVHAKTKAALRNKITAEINAE